MQKYTASVITAGCLWGLMGLFTRTLATYGVDSTGAIVLRCGIAALLFAVTLLVRDSKQFRIRLKDIWCFIGTGICSLLFFTYCYFQAITIMDLSTAAVLLYTAPSSHGNPLPAVRRLGDCSLMNWLWYDDDDPVLPDTLESVGSYIFYDCGVTRVTFPDGITELSPYTFYCTDLQEVHLPASLREIPDYCFWNCQLIALTIPDGVTRIGAHAVDWFTGEIIGAVTLPASVEFVGFRAFPDECEITALNPDTHFETEEEINQRNPDWAYRIP